MIMFGKDMITIVGDSLRLPLSNDLPPQVSKLTWLLKENFVCISSVTNGENIGYWKKFHTIEKIVYAHALTLSLTKLFCIY